MTKYTIKNEKVRRWLKDNMTQKRTEREQGTHGRGNPNSKYTHENTHNLTSKEGNANVNLYPRCNISHPQMAKISLTCWQGEWKF